MSKAPEKQEEKKKEEERTKFVKRDGEDLRLYEAIDTGFMTALNGRLFVEPSIELDKIIYVPAKQRSVPYPLYKMPNIGNPDIGVVYGEIFDIVDNYWDHDEVLYKHVITSFDIGTYQQEKFNTAPQLFFVGDNESGKTRALELIAGIGYRCLYGTSFPSADIFTFLGTEEMATLCEDEIQGLEKETDKIKIYKTGYRKGTQVPRITITPSGKRVVEYYPTFGFKAFAAEKLPGDFLKGFRERMIEIQCIEGEPAFDEFRPEDLERMTEIRNELLAWRVLNFNSLVLPKIDLSLKGRMRERWQPLLQVAKIIGGDCWGTMSKSIGDMINSRLENKRQTFEGRLVSAVLKLIQEKGSLEVSSEDIWSRCIDEFDGFIDERKPNTMDTPEFGPVTKDRVGKRLSETLDAKTSLKKDKGKVTRQRSFQLEKLTKAARKFKFDFDFQTGLGVTGVTPVTGPQREGEVVKPVERTPEGPMETSTEARTLGEAVTPVTAVTAQNKPRFTCLICKKEAGSMDLLRLHQETAHKIIFSEEKPSPSSEERQKPDEVEYCIFPQVLLEGE